MIIRNVHEAKTQLSKLLQRMLAGERVIIARNNQPIAELKPFSGVAKRRGAFGLYKEQISFVGNIHEVDEELQSMFLESLAEEHEDDSD